MATFVLVHGAWHGGWCWRDVAADLRGRGHTVFTPTLSGLGERSHQVSHDIDIDTHIADILNVLEWEELTGVVLVGHSYGGMVITGVADRARDRIGRLVYLDAFVPEDGDSSATMTVRLTQPGADDRAVEVEIARRRAAANVSGGVPPDRTRMFDLPREPADRYDWVARRVVPHPVNTQITPVRLKNGGGDGLPRTYILCTEASGPTPFVTLAKTIRTDDSWIFRELKTTHDAMVTEPDAVADLLDEAAQQTGGNDGDSKLERRDPRRDG
ncbi:MAG: alpha/beta fold hydrolase [Alphaproteobacteria bacterium]